MVKGKSLDEMECFESVLKATAKDRSVPKLTDWDFGIPLVILPALRTHFQMKIGRQQNKSHPSHYGLGQPPC